MTTGWKWFENEVQIADVLY